MTDRPIIFSAPERDRFMAKVMPEPNSGCWLWMGATNPKGYGRFGNEMAHRAALRFEGVAVPEGFTVDHLCRVRGCVNPSHLEPVPHRENLARGTGFVGENLRRTHCPQGHAYDGRNLIARGGHRNCRECCRARQEGVYQPKTTRRRRRHLTPDEVDQVRSLISKGIPHRRIAAEMNLSVAAISNIRTGKSRYVR